MPPGQWSRWASSAVSVTLFSGTPGAHSVEMTDRAIVSESFVPGAATALSRGKDLYAEVLDRAGDQVCSG